MAPELLAGFQPACWTPRPRGEGGGRHFLEQTSSDQQIRGAGRQRFETEGKTQYLWRVGCRLCTGEGKGGGPHHPDSLGSRHVTRPPNATTIVREGARADSGSARIAGLTNKCD